MKNLKLISVVLAVGLCGSQSAAWARPGYGHDCGPRCDWGRMDDRHGHHGNKWRFQNGHDNRPDRDRRDDWRGAGPARDLYRGQYLPPYYRGRQYVVDDWRGHGLYAPPRGHHWVQVGADYLLVAIATGIIVELLLDR